MKRFQTLVAGCLATLLLAAGQAAHAQDKIRLGILPFSESLGAVVADKEGFFKAEGLDVEMTKVNSGAEALPLLQAGRLDIVFSNTVSTLQALEQGLQATLLAPGAVVRTKGPDSTATLLALKGTIKSAKDWEGKRVATNIVNSTNWLYDVVYLEKIGVGPSKVRFVEIPFPQMNDPLLNGQVDVISQVEPFKTVLLGTGKVEALAEPYVAVQPNGDITQYIALTAWTQKNPETANRFARAIRKAAEFANNPANAEKMRELNMQFTNLNPALKDKVTLPRFGTAVNAAEIRKTMELLLKYGVLKKPVDVTGRVLELK